ncbi:MAG: hypothetical protein U9R58_01290 [Chloroflexota bacterium]|nr:hypothetical protein [Chloroflexota bacterium]
MSSRKVILLSITLIGLTFFTAACQTPAGDTTQVVEDNPLVGDWVQTIAGDPNYSRFNADGTFSVAHLYNDLEEYPVISGTFFYEDSILTLNGTPDPPSRQDCSGKTARFTVKFDQTGELILGVLESECVLFNFFANENNNWVPYSP